MTALVAGTFDTKGDELRYIAGLIADTGLKVACVDLSTSEGDRGCDRGAAEIAACHADGAGAVFDAGDRGAAVTAMAQAFETWVAARDDITGMIGAGGSGGTALIAPGMRALPVGVPKVLVSTVASGQVGHYVGPSDIAMIYSVTDVAGLNRISRKVLGNAAHMLVGALTREARAAETDARAVGLTMFGVTTHAVTRVAETLRDTWEPLVFHATGTGGQSMEKLVASGLIEAVIDLTTTEIADRDIGGIFPATDDRLGAMIRAGVPYVGSVGALDMVNFGPRETVPDRFADRLFHIHNPQVTLMRTTADENAAFGAWIAARLNEMRGPWRFLLPEGGVSALDAPGQPFDDPAVRAALFDALEAGVTKRDRLIRVPHNINTDAFADAALAVFAEVT